MKRFIELEYTGKIKDGNVFDTTNEKVATENGILNPSTKYGPITICLGEGHMIKGLDEELIDKKEGNYTIEVECEKAFGKRDGKLIQLIPTQKLKQNNIKPYPGLQLNVDGTIATVKTVSSGRCMVDFNHPLSGRDLVYDIKILRDVTDKVEQAKAILNIEAHLKPEIVEKDGNLEIIGKIPEETKKTIEKRLSELIDAKISFKDDKSS